VNAIESSVRPQPISDGDFRKISDWFYHRAGIRLSDQKKALVSGRLASRLRHHHLTRFGDYFDMLHSAAHPEEPQVAIDLLTTNETSFFREPKHFEFLRRQADEAAAARRPLRVWSAASSSGEEAYSIAMVLASNLGSTGFDVLGTDISTRVLQRARAGHYPMERARHIPQPHLKRFCLRGTGEQTGTLLIERGLRSRVAFAHVNLNADLPQLGTFDVIFLRNVMIYFNGDTKREVVARVLSLLKPGGHFLIGHSESLNEVSSAVQQVAPSIYRKG